ncbi:MAG: ISNCY family transposase [Acidimicrobiia bacterium]
MGETLVMSAKERVRVVELKSVEGGEQSLVQAAARMGLSYRQAKRVWHRYGEQGDAGLVHRSRGRPSNRRKPETVRQRCLELYREQLEGFGPTLASELLAKRWDLEVDHETLRRWLLAEGLWRIRRRRPPHRRWRERRKRFGELVQMDGSHHDWFGQGRKDCLMAAIDDATSRRKTWMATGETTVDALKLLWLWIERYGIPRSLYVDRKSVFITEREPTLEEQLEDRLPATAFGRVCQKLDIEIIAAGSAQAKGRVERSHGVYQDRLVKLIRLDGLSSYEQVNAFLEPFDEELNERFAVEPASSIDVHRPVPPGMDLADVFVLEHTRTVQNDWTVRFENSWYQITGPKTSLPPAKDKVQVLRRLDGTLAIHYRGRPVEYEKLPERPPKAKALPASAKPKPPAAPWRPAADHPWRRPISKNAPSLAPR